MVADPTPQKMRDVIDHIVRQRIEQGQLREAPLTLKQLEIVKSEFVRVLSGMYHSRVEYPAASGGVSAEFAAVDPNARAAMPTGEVAAIPEPPATTRAASTPSATTPPAEEA